MERAANVATCEALLARCAAGELSPEITLLQLLMACGAPGAVAERVRSYPPSPRIAEITALLERHAGGCARVAGMLEWVTQSPPAGVSSQAALSFWRALFDRAASASEEASVALYSMGSPELLEAATNELMCVLEGWGCIPPSARVLDLGCGIGRVTRALAGRVRSVDGLDVSRTMLEAARRRCSALANVRFFLGSGMDLAQLGDASYELVLAVDSFPFVVSAGAIVVDALLGEVARVLCAGGRFALFNYSYRGDLAQDVCELRAAAAPHGLVPSVEAARPFSLWDGAAFLLSKIPRA